jgi:hypothetical protein
MKLVLYKIENANVNHLSYIFFALKQLRRLEFWLSDEHFSSLIHPPTLNTSQ